MIDLRSDTVTRPTPAMREAMASAEVGDDVFGDDPTVLALQEEVAALAGREAALFVPSGTMANQLAVRAHTRMGDEVLLHARSHIFNYESGGAAAISGVHCRPIDSGDGTLPLDALAASRHDGVDPHQAPTRLVCAENTHNGCGGVPVPVEQLREVVAWARGHGLRTHLDGARLWNAKVALGVSLREAAAGFDTVSLCFSKGLGAPAGSILVGDADTIRVAHRFRKMFGGGMRQVGVLAAAARYALHHHVDRLAEDHGRAQRFREEVAGLAGVECSLSQPITNLVYFRVSAAHPLMADGDRGVVEALREHGVSLLGSGGVFRAAFHLDVDDAGLEQVVDAFRRIFG